MGKGLFTGRLRSKLVFTIHTFAPLISESLLGNTLLTAIFLKCLGTFPSFYLSLVLIFVVARVNLLHIHVSNYPKMITDAIYLTRSALHNS